MSSEQWLVRDLVGWLLGNVGPNPPLNCAVTVECEIEAEVGEMKTRERIRFDFDTRARQS